MRDLSLWTVFKVGAVTSFVFSLMTGFGTALVEELTGHAAPHQGLGSHAWPGHTENAPGTANTGDHP